MHFAQYSRRLIVDRQFEAESLTRIDDQFRTNEFNELLIQLKKGFLCTVKWRTSFYT